MQAMENAKHTSSKFKRTHTVSKEYRVIKRSVFAKCMVLDSAKDVFILFFYLKSLLCLSAGSSTACIVILDRQSHRLHTANLGDSGFLVVRGGEVVHRSDEQQHYFNTPFQLSIAPPGAEGAVLSDRWDTRICCPVVLQGTVYIRGSWT